MQSKLTLRIDERLIQQAKKQARTRGTSVSALVASYFAALDADGASERVTPVVQRLRGILRDSSASPDAYREHLQEKHGVGD